MCPACSCVPAAPIDTTASPAAPDTFPAAPAPPSVSVAPAAPATSAAFPTLLVISPAPLCVPAAPIVSTVRPDAHAPPGPPFSVTFMAPASPTTSPAPVDAVPNAPATLTIIVTLTAPVTESEIW